MKRDQQHDDYSKRARAGGEDFAGVFREATRGTRRAEVRSKMGNTKAGNSLEISEIQRRHFKPEMQCCCADQQVFKRKLNALRFLLAFDATGQPCDVECHRVYRHVAGQLLDEIQSPLLQCLCFGAIGSVHQLCDRNYRQTDFDLALTRANLFQDLQDSMASALRSDNDA